MALVRRPDLGWHEDNDPPPALSANFDLALSGALYLALSWFGVDHVRERIRSTLGGKTSISLKSDRRPPPTITGQPVSPLYRATRVNFRGPLRPE